MGQASADTLAQLMLGLGVLLALVIAGALVVQRFRGSAADKGPTANELMSKFQEMKRRGDISDADYRKIRSVLGNQLPGRPKDDKTNAS
jgi:flagellar biogenesis protein FliO